MERPGEYFLKPKTDRNREIDPDFFRAAEFVVSQIMDGSLDKVVREPVLYKRMNEAEAARQEAAGEPDMPISEAALHAVCGVFVSSDYRLLHYQLFKGFVITDSAHQEREAGTLAERIAPFLEDSSPAE